MDHQGRGDLLGQWAVKADRVRKGPRGSLAQKGPQERWVLWAPRALQVDLAQKVYEGFQAQQVNKDCWEHQVRLVHRGPWVPPDSRASKVIPGTRERRAMLDSLG